MKINSRNEIIEILKMPNEEFLNTIAPIAKEIHKKENDNRLLAISMLGFDNICKNNCLYCGMRASNSSVERYRLKPQDIIDSAKAAKNQGFNRIFLISGEDPKYGFQNIIYFIKEIKKLGMHLSLACGEFSDEQFREIKSAGTDRIVLKFEMSQKETFNRLNPSTDFSKRIEAIETVKKLGFSLASGNIVDYPHQSIEDIADDILLMKELDISWAPIIPYLPAQNTPLALEGGRGDIYLNLKEIAILRIMMPNIEITAQQPGTDLRQGLAGEEGNLLALNCGADSLFADLLPNDKVLNFSVVDNRITLGLEHIRKMSKLANMNLTF